MTDSKRMSDLIRDAAGNRSEARQSRRGALADRLARRGDGSDGSGRGAGGSGSGSGSGGASGSGSGSGSGGSGADAGDVAADYALFQSNRAEWDRQHAGEEGGSA